MSKLNDESNKNESFAMFLTFGSVNLYIPNVKYVSDRNTHICKLLRALQCINYIIRALAGV